MARAVGDSPLVKTAIFGRDPNWGRVTQAVGAALARRPGPFREPDIRVDGVPSASAEARLVLAQEEYDGIDLGRGAAGAELWACDPTPSTSGSTPSTTPRRGRTAARARRSARRPAAAGRAVQSGPGSIWPREICPGHGFATA